jgi:hypothetical protein
VKSTRIRNLAIVAIVLVLFMASGLRIGHPRMGLSTALGGGQTTLVVYKKAKNFEVGNKVVVSINEGGGGLGVITAVNSDSYDVNLGKKFERIMKDKMGGSLLAVLPFFGVLFGVIGL